MLVSWQGKRTLRRSGSTLHRSCSIPEWDYPNSTSSHFISPSSHKKKFLKDIFCKRHIFFKTLFLTFSKKTPPPIRRLFLRRHFFWNDFLFKFLMLFLKWHFSTFFFQKTSFYIVFLTSFKKNFFFSMTSFQKNLFKRIPFFNEHKLSKKQFKNNVFFQDILKCRCFSHILFQKTPLNKQIFCLLQKKLHV